MSRILPLPADAISQIHSSKNITSLQDVVLALLENSLDAGSTKIDVTIDFRRGGCTVGDDGDGIAAAEFGEGGGLGKMYHTSKRLPQMGSKRQLHGNAGTFLASLASLSLLKVSSTRRGSSQTGTISLHQGKVISRHASASNSSELPSDSAHGTEVAIRDLFGNIPVRIKQRALAADEEGRGEKAWHLLKHGVAALLLAWPHPTSVRLTDCNCMDRKVHLAGSNPSFRAELTRSGLQQLEGGRQRSFGLREALSIVFQAGLALPDTRQSWIPVSASAVDVTVRGLICLDPMPTKQCQFVSLGIRPCINTTGQGDIYEAINKVFANSNFGSAEALSDVDEQEKDRRKRDRRYKGDGFTQKQLQGRKGVDRWPMFVLQVNVRDQSSRYAGMSDSLNDRAIQSITGVLEATVAQWLTAHHFRPRNKRKRRGYEDQHGPPTTLSRQRSFSTNRADSRNQSVDIVNPDQGRSTTSQSVPMPRAYDRPHIPERLQSMCQATAPSPGHSESPFALWSRIKSGKPATSLKQPSSRDAASTPEKATEFVEGGERRASRSTFTLPDIGAGSLNAARQRHAAIHRSSHAEIFNSSSSIAPEGSSEEYSGFEDEELIAAAAATEVSIGVASTDEQLKGTDADEQFEWVDPNSKQKYRVNSRTGVVLPVRPQSAQRSVNDKDASQPQRHPAAINTTVSSTGQPLILARRRRSARPDTAPLEGGNQSWLPGFLREWNNPVFANQNEEPIPVALPSGPGLESEETSKRLCAPHSLQPQFNNLASKATDRLTKDALRTAKIISQVDKKFILCRTENSTGREGDDLVLVDQHAASERVILEALFAELCGPASEGGASAVRTTMLEKPLRFQVSAKEHDLFVDFRQHFADWGILYDLAERDETIAASQDVRAERRKEHMLAITSLPLGIAERCTMVPRILIEMLRSEVWDAAESRRWPASTKASDTFPAENSDQQHAWLKRIGSCPKGIIELLNSRACRSAIMFNDVLAIEECNELIERLSRCAFPFMCAHGRVSMVLLGGIESADMDDDELGCNGSMWHLWGAEKCGREVKREEGFAAAFRQWRALDADTVTVSNEADRF